MGKSRVTLGAALLPGLLAWDGCHRAERDNPLDPALTPAVTLIAALDDTAGVVSLSWTPYAGSQPFAEYRIRRQAAQGARVDSLAVTVANIGRADSTSWVDTTLAPHTDYQYRVWVANADGYEAPSNLCRVTGYRVGPVALSAVQLEARSGRAEVTWSRYGGPRFAAYRVERRQAGQDEWQPVGTYADRADTVHSDGDLAPDRQYAYRVVLLAAGQEWRSNPSGLSGFTLPSVLRPQVLADPQQGCIHLSWRSFAGPGFSAYRVERREAGEPAAADVVVYRTDALQDTLATDTTAAHGVGYLYEVVVEAYGADARRSDAAGARLLLPPVADLQAEFASATATARLTWSPYAGPGFAAYRVLRRAGETLPVEVERILQPAAAAWEDAQLPGNTEVFYRIDVVTARGDTVVGSEASGSIHRQLLPSWPLDLAEDDYVRLCRAEGGGVYATVAGPTRVRLLHYGAEGQVLLDRVVLESEAGYIEPRSVVLLPVGNGFRLSVGAAAPAQGVLGQVVLLTLDADGRQVLTPRQVLADALAALPDSVLHMPGNVRLVLDSRLVATHVRVLREDQVVLDDDLADGADPAWSPPGTPAAGGVWGRLECRYDGLDGLRVELAGTGYPVSPYAMLSVSVGHLWWDPGVWNAHVSVYPSRWAVQVAMGSSGRSQWTIVSPIFVEGLSLDWWVSFGPRQGRLQLWGASAILLSGQWDRAWPFVGLAGTEEAQVLLAGGVPRLVNVQGQGSADSLTAGACDLRYWTRLDARGRWAQRLGLCLPAEHTVAWAATGLDRRTGQLSWPFSFLPSTVVTMPHGGAGGGQADLLFPLSLDGMTDGRVAVLDAGNARVQVFDGDGGYVTQWGGRGAAEGRFDCGRGRRPEDYAGSLCVDAEGTLYVADAGNRRIQRFAP